MENRIVLGFPYAGAFLWLLSAEEHYKKSVKEKYDGSHPYYITLFGSEHNQIIDETVSLTLLFDEIYIAPVDAHLPGREKYYTQNDGYLNKDLGIYSNWEWINEIGNIEDQVDTLLKDTKIQAYLNQVDILSKKQIIREAINQIHVSNKFDTAIFAIPSYLDLCQRINELINLDSNALKIQSSILPQKAINSVFDIASLRFGINGLEEFAMLKQEKNVRQYAQSFRNYVKVLPSGELDDLSLYKAMLDAINNDSIADKISGGFGFTSTITGIVSLIPGIGTVSGLIGLGADTTSRIAKGQSNKNKWWLLAPEISKQLTKQRIETLYKEKMNK